MRDGKFSLERRVRGGLVVAIFDASAPLSVLSFVAVGWFDAVAAKRRRRDIDDLETRQLVEGT